MFPVFCVLVKKKKFFFLEKLLVVVSTLVVAKSDFIGQMKQIRGSCGDRPIIWSSLEYTEL